MNDVWIIGAIVAVALPIVIRLLTSGAARPIEPGTLRYGKAAKAFGIVITAALPVMVVVILIIEKKPTRAEDVPWILLIISLGLSLGAPLLGEFTRVRIEYDDQVLRIVTPWSRNRHIDWASVQQVRWRASLKWLDFRTADGAVIHVSPLLSGLPAFGEHALKRLPEVAQLSSPEGLAVLMLFARGRGGELVLSPTPPTEMVRRS